ncbi:hypothetical protein PBY51_020658 [Eleginops maclovinus]|uniref:Uncharacterized protein n=1 Tax=Eleginops maclovinus TaxID=56733 RepID=A0AAN7XT52_ELEMC|nr:hypothetical protein PBY51_020658 [Eleginops maclovinus]
MLSIHRLGRRTREKMTEEWNQSKRRRCVAKRKMERKKERKKTSSNPLKYFLNSISTAKLGKQHILWTPPERRL